MALRSVSENGIASGSVEGKGSEERAQSRRLMQSTCLRMVVPSGNPTMYERGPVTSAMVPAIHLGVFPVKFSANTVSPTVKFLNGFVESCDIFCLS